MSTTATYPAGTSITNCFVVNSIADPTQFSYLRILHREPITASDGSVSYVLVDRTVLTGTYAPSFSTRTICAQTTSLSPFVFARVLDGTPPVISSASLSSNPVPLSTATTLSVGASDAQSGGSAISKVEYSLDNGSTWTLIPGSYYRTPSVAVSTGLTLPVGVYGVCVRATDAAQNATTTCPALLAVYDTSAGFLTGGGWITSPVGALTSTPSLTGKATLEFDSKYEKGANVPTGSTQFQLDVGSFLFKSTSYDWLVVAGARAEYKGSGTVNGTAGYSFILTAIDGKLPGGGSDKLRIKIWNTGTGGVVYDNQMGAADAADPTMVIGGGDIVIH